MFVYDGQDESRKNDRVCIDDGEGNLVKQNDGRNLFMTIGSIRRKI